MKQLIARILTSLLTIVLLAAGSAYAQSPAVIKVNIPFEFALGDKTFPAGDYSIVQPLQHLLVLRDARGHTIASTFANGVELSSPPAMSRLRFRLVDGENVLSEVWQQDSTAGFQLKVANTNHRNYVAQRRSQEARQTAEGSQP